MLFSASYKQIFCIREATNLIGMVLNPAAKWVWDVVPPDSKKKKKKTHTQLYKYGPECNTLIFSNLRAFIHELRSVTYHLPLDFWTSLLLKLCDLAVPLVYRGKKKKKHKTVEVIQCVCLWEAEGERHIQKYTLCVRCVYVCAR